MRHSFLMNERIYLRAVEPEYSICTDKAKKLGYQFTELKDWIYELLDYYIQVVEEMDKVDNGRFH